MRHQREKMIFDLYRISPIIPDHSGGERTSSRQGNLKANRLKSIHCPNDTKYICKFKIVTCSKGERLQCEIVIVFTSKTHCIKRWVAIYLNCKTYNTMKQTCITVENTKVHLQL